MRSELFQLLSGLMSSAYLTSEKSNICALGKVRGKSQCRVCSDSACGRAPGGCGLLSLVGLHSNGFSEGEVPSL